MRTMSAATAVLLALSVTGCASTGPEATTEAPAPKTVTITGTFNAPADIEYDFSGGNSDGPPSMTNMVAGDPCGTDGGYSDIRTGTQVTVRAANGETLAVGALGAETFTPAPEMAEGPFPGSKITIGDCSFRSRSKHPDGKDLYGVEVSHRGVITYPREKLNQPIQLTLS
jgi:hypothetical protein